MHVPDDSENVREGSSAGEIEKLALAKPDVILDLGSIALPDAVMELPRLGAWRLQHGNRAANGTDLPGGWEVIRGQTTTCSKLVALHCAADEPRELTVSVAATNQNSINRNRNHCYWKAAQFIPRKIKEYADSPASASPIQDAAFRRSAKPDANNSAGSAAALMGVGRILGRLISNRIRSRLFRKQWFCAFRFDEDSAVENRQFSAFHRMLPPRDRFWADPFPIERDGKSFVFYEEYVWSIGRGRIVVSEVGRDGQFTQPRVVLERPYHLSYPFVFSWNDDWYMIPESGDKRTVELWRCTSWPDKWEFDRNLMENVQAVDSTIAEIDGRYWMFACIAPEGAMPYDELFAFWADTPLGPWHPHAGNPIVSDARCARPAGKLFFRDGKWLRPAQDCTIRYGRRIVVQELVLITPEEYCERPAWTIEPAWLPKLIATHTFNTSQNITVIDGCRWR
jgi:hypothetical protein